MSPRHIWPKYTRIKCCPSAFGSLKTNVMTWTGTGLSLSHCCQVMQNCDAKQAWWERPSDNLFLYITPSVSDTTWSDLYNLTRTSVKGPGYRHIITSEIINAFIINRQSRFSRARHQGVWRATKPIVNICSAGILLFSVIIFAGASMQYEAYR